MPYGGSEYAATDTSFSTLDYVDNNVSRYSCNNVINGNNIDQSMRTYNKLYTIYSTQPPTTVVNSIPSIGSTLVGTDCSGNNTITCPHTLSTTNVYYKGNASLGIGITVKDLGVYLDDCGAQIRNYNNSQPTNYSFYTDKQKVNEFIDGSYNSLLQTRSDLDNKMNEILGINQNSILYEKQNQLDANVYTTVIWTVIITSSLYYIFTKI
jgi:hypothetical protein